MSGKNKINLFLFLILPVSLWAKTAPVEIGDTIIAVEEPAGIIVSDKPTVLQDSILIANFFQMAGKCPIDSAIIRAALFLLNTPYVAHTLEINKEEKLVVNLHETDCTVFVETCLALARALQSAQPGVDNFMRELKRMRYRNGFIDGYISRLHYTSDWLYDNRGKGIIDDMTCALGGRRIKPDVHFMSDNYTKYTGLVNHPENVQSIRAIEQEINARGNYYYIPKQEIAQHQSLIRNGDIICFTTATPGLDISHLGIAYWHKKQLTFIHASSTAKKVIVNPESLVDYCGATKTNTGIMVLRPLSVNEE
ncbi:MAG: DUF1460 domain-containing protein [Dysgonamonadaceae bacterium]|jgi:hypothetical protein|nr:DUF1460 domain-containing protein [Dysgonamonadaceae bacterium]